LSVGRGKRFWRVNFVPEEAHNSPCDVKKKTAGDSETNNPTQELGSTAQQSGENLLLRRDVKKRKETREAASQSARGSSRKS